MNYNEIVTDIVANYQHPCDAEVPVGSYRRVMWEKYNPSLANKGPAINEEWQTEVILINKRVYDKNPFGLKSEPLPVTMGTDPITGQPIDPETTCTGIWSAKIGYCFASQAELQKYVSDIGSTLQPDNNWYGADLSKSNLFKHARELEMYRLENTGAIWTLQGPKVDKRTCMMYDDSTKASTKINFNNVSNDRSAYLKHYEDKPCAYVGMKVNSQADTSIPGIPIAIAVAVAALPPIFSDKCLPVEFGFPYTNISKSIMSAWNKTSQDFKLFWDSLPGLPKGEGSIIATMYDNLSVSMQELGQSALAFSQYALQLAWKQFTEIISAAMNIVGGGWEMIKRFLPKISILGVNIDILELCTDPNGVQKLKDQIPSTDQAIDAIYSVIGSSYRYAIEYIKVRSRDIVDAITDLYDWAWANLQYAGVAMCKLLGELAQIWSMPPEVPNPVWLAIKAVREIFSQIPPLDIIMSGNFPGFTASELYDMIMKYINQKREEVLLLVSNVAAQIKAVEEQLMSLKKSLTTQESRYQQYLSGMWEQVKEETTAMYKAQIDALKVQINSAQERLTQLINERFNLLDQINNVMKMGMDYLKQLPIMSTVNQLLGLAGASIDSIIDMVKNAETGLESLYEDFVEGCRNLKDVCKTIYNQVCTLAMSKVTQWVNKLLSILSLVITFPSMSFCVPMIEYPKITGL